MTAGPKRNLKLRYIVLAMAIVLVIAGWTGGWFYFRQELDRQIEAQLQAVSGTGALVTCPDRQIAGFPFRFEITCLRPSAAAIAGPSFSLDKLNAIALVYNPWHIIFEADGPAALTDPVTGLTYSASWDTARSSLLFSKTGPKQIDVVLDKIVSLPNETGIPGPQADHVEFHLRPAPETSGAIEAFMSADGFRPAGSGSLDARAHVRLESGAGLLAGQQLADLPRMEDGALPIELALLSLASGNTEITARGPLHITASGALDGKVELQIKEIDGMDKLLGNLFPEGSTLPASLKGTAVALGTPGEDAEGNPVIKVPLTIDQGSFKVGIVPLGITIPPLAASVN